MNYSIAIKALREKLLLSQMDLAKKLGVSFASVNRWEQGHHEPTIKAKRKINDLLKENDITISNCDDIFLECLKHKERYPLMEQALTDSSYKKWQQENKKDITKDNTILATYGDAVLKLAFCEVLYPDEKLSEKKAGYECDKSLVLYIGKKYDILKYIHLDDTDPNRPCDYEWKEDSKKDNPHKKIATCIEAIIGAIYQKNHDMNEIVDIAKNWKEYIDSQKDQNEYERP